MKNIAVIGYGFIGKRVADAIRALTGIEMDAVKSISKTNKSLGIL